jgi:hypothetical protein
MPSRRTNGAVLSRDTSREAEQVQVGSWRSMSAVQKAHQIAGAWRAARALAIAGLGARHPHSTPAELSRRLATITLQPSLAVLAYADAHEMCSQDHPQGDLVDVTLTVTAALEQCGIRYTVGGSLASSFAGEPRSSIDADIVVDMRHEQIDSLLALLGDEFYADVDGLRRAIRSGSSANLVHRPTGVKVDLFAASSLLDRQQLERRRRIRVKSAPDRFMFVHSPEDILLQKLHWYRSGGEVSERQWRDVLSIVLVQGERLDREYLAGIAAQAGVDDLLIRAFSEAGG